MVNNIQPKQQIPYGGIKEDILKEQNPNEKIKNATNEMSNAVNDSAGAQMLSGMFEGMDVYSPKTWGVIGGFWAAFAGLNDLLNHNLKKNWDSTIFGKMGQFGDKVEGQLKSKCPVGVSNASKKAINFIKDKLPFLTTPLNPENSMARSQAGGIYFQVSSGMNSILTKYMKKNPNGYKNLFTNAKNVEEATAWLELIAKDPKLHADKFEDLMKNLTKNQDVIGSKCKVALNKYLSVGQKYLKNPTNKTWLGKKLSTLPLSVTEFATNGAASGKLFIGIQAIVFAQALFKAAKAPKGEKKATFMENVMGDFVYAAAAPLMLMPANTIGALKYVGMGKGAASHQAAVKNYREVLNSLNTLIKHNKLEGDALIKSGIIKDAKDIVVGLDGKVQGIDVIAQKGKKVLKDMLYKDAKWYQKPLKKIGEFFSMGLETVSTKGISLKGKAGGALRLVLAMFVVAPMISKITRTVSHKLFGKPTSAIKEDEEAKAKKAEKKAEKETKKANREKMKNINKDELVKRLEAQPELVNKIENDPELTAKIQKDPMLLINMLEEAEKTPIQPQAQNTNLSPALQNLINKNQMSNINNNPQSPNTQANFKQPKPEVSIPQNNQTSIQAEKKEETTTFDDPKRSYVPSSTPIMKSASEIQHDANLKKAMASADEAEKYALEQLGIN